MWAWHYGEEEAFHEYLKPNHFSYHFQRFDMANESEEIVWKLNCYNVCINSLGMDV
jgi:hypothetical protein